MMRPDTCSARRPSSPAPRRSAPRGCCGKPRARSRRLPETAARRTKSAEPSGQGDVALVALLGALELEELVVAAARAVGILATYARARFIHGAAALLLVEEHARRIEDAVLAVPQERHALRSVELGEALLGASEFDAEMACEALDVVLRHLDVAVGAAEGRALAAGIVGAHRNGKRLGVFHGASIGEAGILPALGAWSGVDASAPRMPPTIV